MTDGQERVVSVRCVFAENWGTIDRENSFNNGPITGLVAIHALSAMPADDEKEEMSRFSSKVQEISFFLE